MVLMKNLEEGKCRLKYVMSVVISLLLQISVDMYETNKAEAKVGHNVKRENYTEKCFWLVFFGMWSSSNIHI